MVLFPNGVPLPFEHRQEPMHVGRSAYIQLYDGSKTRTKRMVGGEWAHATQTGNAFYKQNQLSCIVGMPAIKQIANRAGTLVRVETQFDVRQCA